MWVGATQMRFATTRSVALISPKLNTLALFNTFVNRYTVYSLQDQLPSPLTAESTGPMMQNAKNSAGCVFPW